MGMVVKEENMVNTDRKSFQEKHPRRPGEKVSGAS
jgi:hypothetical protein